MTQLTKQHKRKAVHAVKRHCLCVARLSRERKRVEQLKRLRRVKQVKRAKHHTAQVRGKQARTKTQGEIWSKTT